MSIRFMDTVITRTRLDLASGRAEVTLPPLDAAPTRYEGASASLHHIEGFIYDLIVTTYLYPEDMIEKQEQALAAQKASAFELAESLDPEDDLDG